MAYFTVSLSMGLPFNNELFSQILCLKVGLRSLTEINIPYFPLPTQGDTRVVGKSEGRVVRK